MTFNLAELRTGSWDLLPEFNHICCLDVPELGESNAGWSWDTNKQNFKMISLFFSSYTSFRTFCIFAHKMQKHTPIELKLDAHKGLITANLRTSFGWYPINI